MNFFANPNGLLPAILAGAISLSAQPAFSAEAKKAPSKADLAKASQNPVAAMISVPFENNATLNNGPDNVFVDVLNIKPVIPMKLTETTTWTRLGICPARRS